MTGRLRLSFMVSSLMIGAIIMAQEQAVEPELKRSHSIAVAANGSSHSSSTQSPQSSPSVSPGTSPSTSNNTSPSTSPGSSPSNPRSGHRGSAGCVAYMMYDCPTSRKSPVMMGRTNSMSPTPRCP